MQIIDIKEPTTVDVFDIAPGSCFKTQEKVFIRIHEIDTAITHDGGALRTVVGVDLNSGGYYCADRAEELLEYRQVIPVEASVRVE